MTPSSLTNPNSDANTQSPRGEFELMSCPQLTLSSDATREAERVRIKSGSCCAHQYQVSIQATWAMRSNRVSTSCSAGLENGHFVRAYNWVCGSAGARWVHLKKSKGGTCRGQNRAVKTNMKRRNGG